VTGLGSWADRARSGPFVGRRTDINRDSLWPMVAEHGLRPITQIAVDEVCGPSLPAAQGWGGAAGGCE